MHRFQPEKPQLDDGIEIMTLKHHLNGETLPSADNYHPHFLAIGSRSTLDELHLGEIGEKVS